MFFFIGGIQPKTVTLDNQPRLCPSCGLAQARLKRVDHYLSLFFIPIFPVKKGTPFLECRRCGAVSDESGEISAYTPPGPGSFCQKCGQRVDPGFRFCPYCGSPLR
ncbi:MAG: zinc ribbon domain-containing protein [Deltaproteobacteria bacterium]